MAVDPERGSRAARRERAGAQTRERILEAARCACAEHGASVQIDDVARGAGVGAEGALGGCGGGVHVTLA